MTKPRTFMAWLRAQGGREDGIGDLARDVLTDRAHTRRMRSYPALYAYLLPIACTTALEALERAHREYQEER
jgi:hypothetical protein